MYLHVVSVFDDAAQVFGRPMFVPARGVAVRSFTDEVNRPDADNPLHNHPGDFALYRLGGFDDNLGKFDLADMPELLVRASNVKAKE